jgi:hypothetical protein
MLFASNRRGIAITYSGETKRVDFDTERGDIFLFEFTSQMALDESGLCDD